MNNILDIENDEEAINKDCEIVSKTYMRQVNKINKTVVGYNGGGKFDEDFEDVRSTLNELMEDGKTILNGIMKLAREAETTKPYETAASVIKTISDVGQDLIELHKKAKEIKKTETKESDVPDEERKTLTSPAELLDEIEEEEANNN